MNNNRILVIPDLHCPHQHQDAVAFLTALKAKYKPTRVVCLGDEIDAHAMSFHDSDPDLASAGHELNEAIQALQPLYELFPRVDLIDSNHGSMLYRRGKHHGIPRKMLRDYGDILEAPKGWVWTHDLTLTLPNGNLCYFHHGLSSDVMNVVNKRGVCAVQGHYHGSFSIGYAGNPHSLLWGLQSGCLVNKESMAFAYDRNNLPRPIIGASIVIDSLPRLLPMVLNSKGRWDKTVP